MNQKPSAHNVQQAVPFFAVRSMDDSLGFYVDGLGFSVKNKWIERGVLRWCWLELGDAALMLQETRPEQYDESVVAGQGVSICFMCQDALAIYHEARSAGLEPDEPFVGNALWITTLRDPDGYRIEFESPTDVPEGTRLSQHDPLAGEASSG